MFMGGGCTQAQNARLHKEIKQNKLHRVGGVGGVDSQLGGEFFSPSGGGGFFPPREV